MATLRRLDFSSETVGDIFLVLWTMLYGDLVVSKKGVVGNWLRIFTRRQYSTGDGSVMRKIRWQWHVCSAKFKGIRFLSPSLTFPHSSIVVILSLSLYRTRGHKNILYAHYAPRRIYLPMFAYNNYIIIERTYGYTTVIHAQCTGGLLFDRYNANFFRICRP